MYLKNGHVGWKLLLIWGWERLFSFAIDRFGGPARISNSIPKQGKKAPVLHGNLLDLG